MDGELAPRLASCGARAIERVVAEAIARFHPELLEQRERAGKAGWHVTLQQPPPGQAPGTSYLDVAGDTLDLARFYALVCEQAAALGAAGDTDPLEVRKAKALGVIADQSAPAAPAAPGTPAAADEPAAPGGRRAARTTLYLHCSLADLFDPTDPTEMTVGEVEKLGPVTVAKIRDWVGRTDVTVRPVLDLAATAAVDRHDPPEAMREQVILRDQHCIFPWCQRDARDCDLDHISPLRRARPTGPDPPRQPRTPVPAPPPLQNRRPLAIPTQPRRHLPVALTPGPHLPRHPDRHDLPPGQLSTRLDHPTPVGRSSLLAGCTGPNISRTVATQAVSDVATCAASACWLSDRSRDSSWW